MVAAAKGKKAKGRKARNLKHRKTILRKTPLILPIPIQFAEQLLPAKVKRILRYEIKGILGEGGFGKVVIIFFLTFFFEFIYLFTNNILTN